MTKQDKWSIKIGGGYGFPNKKVYPEDRLLALIKFRPVTNKEVGDFCTKYQLIPRGYQDLGLLKAFKKEQSEISDVVNKILKKVELSNDDLNKISFNLNNIRKDMQILSEVDIKNVNQPLSGNHNEVPKDYYPINVFVHGDSTVSLWEEVSQLAINNSLIRQCIRCKSLYKPKSKHVRKYCDNPNCGNSNRQDRFLQKSLNKTS